MTQISGIDAAWPTPCSAFVTRHASRPLFSTLLFLHSFAFCIFTVSEHAASLFPLIFHLPCHTGTSQHLGLPYGLTMSYAYQRSTGGSSLPSFNSIPSSSAGLISQACNRAIPAAKQWIEEGVTTLRSSRPRNREEARNSARVVLRRLFSVPFAVILLWFFTLWWGERTVFQESIDACAWEAWEAWVSLLTRTIL